MSDRLALDANAIIAHLRDHEIPTLPSGPDVVVPVTVLGELYAGAYASMRHDLNIAAIETFVAKRVLIGPYAATARHYGLLRAEYRTAHLSIAKTNDLWIAALCLQHDIPLLSNDRGFDVIPGLTVIHW